MKNCKTCGNSFEAKDPRKQYCSNKCKWTFDNKKALKKVADEKSAIKIKDLPGEIWKDIEGFEGFYQISNFGRLKGLRYNNLTSRGSENVNFLFPERLLKGSITKYGYRKFILSKDSVQTSHFHHRLIAVAFISNPENLDTVNHKDGNKLNNEIENLEWLSLSDNTKHAWETGLNKTYSREGWNGNSKQCRPVKCLKTGKIWESTKSAAKDLSMTVAGLKYILSGRSKSNNDYVYANQKPSTQIKH